MKRKDDFVVDVQAAAKQMRTLIRLKHSLAADREINDKVPLLVEAITTAAVTGKPYKLDTSKLIAELL